jgi:hypothetical protein
MQLEGLTPIKVSTFTIVIIILFYLFILQFFIVKHTIYLYKVHTCVMYCLSTLSCTLNASLASWLSHSHSSVEPCTIQHHRTLVEVMPQKQRVNRCYGVPCSTLAAQLAIPLPHLSGALHHTQHTAHATMLDWLHRLLCCTLHARMPISNSVIGCYTEHRPFGEPSKGSLGKATPNRSKSMQAPHPRRHTQLHLPPTDSNALPASWRPCETMSVRHP